MAERTSLKIAGEQARKAAKATEMRDYWIREARCEGLSLRAIGDATGLSHTAIKKIVDRFSVSGGTKEEEEA